VRRLIVSWSSSQLCARTLQTSSVCSTWPQRRCSVRRHSSSDAAALHSCRAALLRLQYTLSARQRPCSSSRSSGGSGQWRWLHFPSLRISRDLLLLLQRLVGRACASTRFSANTDLPPSTARVQQGIAAQLVCLYVRCVSHHSFIHIPNTCPTHKHTQTHPTAACVCF